MPHGTIQLPRRMKRRRKRHDGPGTPPGTMVAHPDASPTRVRLVRYNTNECHSEDPLSDAPANSVGDWIQPAANSVTWIDVGGLRDTELIHRIGKQFGLHSLALEDAVNVHQRPKVDVYNDHLFVVARAHLSGTVDSQQVALFLGRDFVISFQECESDCLASVRARIEAAKGRIRECGADYLLYALLDVVVDSYFPALEEYGERLDALDDRISTEGEQSLINEIHGVRTELLAIRRSIWPLREALNTLIRDSGDMVSDETDLYLRDCYDHTVQIIDVIETDRELCADLRDFYLTVASNRMNQVMKFLTIIATLFIPLSFIAGLYGMNFNTQASSWNMPELNWSMGYPFVVGLMGTVACSLLCFFWRRGWLT